MNPELFTFLLIDPKDAWWPVHCGIVGLKVYPETIGIALSICSPRDEWRWDTGMNVLLNRIHGDAPQRILVPRKWSSLLKPFHFSEILSKLTEGFERGRRVVAGHPSNVKTLRRMFATALTLHGAVK